MDTNNNNLPENTNLENATPINDAANQVAPTNIISGTTGNLTTPPQPKKNGKMIAILAAIIIVLIAVVVALVIILLNKDSAKSQTSNKGNNHYEEDVQSESNSNNTSNNNSNTGTSVSCLGYSFRKIEGYKYDCQADGLMIESQVFALYLETLNGMSYYQAEGHASLLASNLEKTGKVTIKSHRQYTASTGRKMLIFDAISNGVNMYIFITAASSSEVLVGQVANSSAYASTSDLETAASILDDSTIASKLPDETENDTEELPEMDFDIQIKALEFSE